MKKIILAATLIISSLGIAYSQAKEGSVTYEVKMEGLDPANAAMMDGTEFKVYFKNNKTRSEFTNAFLTKITINDGTKTTVLTEETGRKLYYEVPAEDMKKADDKSANSTIEYKDETKKIAGYDCKKAIIKSKNEKGEEMTMFVWYTEQLPNSGQGSKGKQNFMKDLKGAPLEFEGQFGPFKMKFTATSVSTAPVADAKFIPNTDGYIKTTQEEQAKKMMGGGK